MVPKCTFSYSCDHCQGGHPAKSHCGDQIICVSETQIADTQLAPIMSASTVRYVPCSATKGQRLSGSWYSVNLAEREIALMILQCIGKLTSVEDAFLEVTSQKISIIQNACHLEHAWVLPPGAARILHRGREKKKVSWLIA